MEHGFGVANSQNVCFTPKRLLPSCARRSVAMSSQESDSLWRLLVCLAAHKAIDHARRERSLKRCGGAGREEVDLEQVMGSESTPAFAAQVGEECQQLLAALPTEELRSLAVWRMEGWTIQEIADRLGRSVTTVNRKLDVIRQVWTAQEPPGEPDQGQEDG
jgi:DNA-directed RNA polymerase specialized sigma24 family protein